MKLSDLLNMKKGVKGLDTDLVTIKKVQEKKEHPGKLWQGKQLPAWHTQSLCVSDESAETWVQISKGFLTNEAEGKTLILNDIEINEYKNSKGETVKSLICHSKGLNLSGEAKTVSEPVKEPLSPTIKQEAHKSMPLNGNGATNWDAKERRELRKTIWDTVFMTVFKDLPINENSESMLGNINYMAEKGFEFVYELDKTKVDSGEGNSDLPF